MSSSPEPTLLANQPKSSSKTQKSKSKTSSKSKSNAVAVTGAAGTSSGITARNEGDDPYWAYEPPAGSKLLEHDHEDGDDAFDWDAVKNDDDVEIWLVRAPEGVKPKHLSGMLIDEPPSSSASQSSKRRTTKAGTLSRKNASYDAWYIDNTPRDTHDRDDEDQNEDRDDDGGAPIGAEELPGLTCLLPRKKKGGKLYTAPKPIARHLVITAAPAPSSPVQILQQNPPRPSYPPDVLKHRFTPLGAREPNIADTDEAQEGDGMEVDELAPAKVKKSKEEKDKAKKRKGEKGEAGEAPKKTKKAKTAG